MSNFAYALFRAGLTAYLLDAQSKPAPGMTGQQSPWQMPQSSKQEVEIELFPGQSARVQRFRTQQQAATRSGFKGSHPRIKIKKEYRERARIDYENARGTIHRRLLLDAEPHLQRKARDAHKRVVALEDEVRGLESARDAEMRRAVTRPLVARELATLPGIGRRMAEAIQKQVFNGDLESLRWSFQVDGIGPQKQATINAWIDQRTMLLPGLLNGAYPEKAWIAARYDQEIPARHTDLSKAKAHENECRSVLEQVYNALDWLMTVTQRDFEMAYADTSGAQGPIARYLLGVFSPWDTMPDWFARALDLARQAH